MTISKAKRAQVREVHGCKCYFCGKQMEPSVMTIDHLVAKANGGTNDLGNLVPSCRKCNSVKNNRSLEWLRLHEALKRTRYYGIINAGQAADLIAIGVDLEIPAHYFHFELEGVK